MANPEFRLPIREFTCTLASRGGLREDVVLFLATRSVTYPRGETIDELLEGEREFLPVRSVQTERSWILARDAILTIKVPPDAPARCRMEEYVAQSSARVRIQLDKGVRVDGTMRAVFDSPAPRLSDWLNQKDPFVAVDTAEGLVFVNKRWVLSVTQATV
jgi:hypothetical protein